MPIYILGCNACKKISEQYLSMDSPCPNCECGGQLEKRPTSPAAIFMKQVGNVRIHSKGYKEGYAKEVRKSTGVES